MERVPALSEASSPEGAHDRGSRHSEAARPGRVAPAEIDRATDFLVNSAGPLGAAKARAVKADKMLGHIEALQALASDKKTADARKWDARASQEYIDAINEHAEAEGELSKLYGLRQAAQAKVDAWRTEAASMRGNRA